MGTPSKTASKKKAAKKAGGERSGKKKADNKQTDRKRTENKQTEKNKAGEKSDRKEGHEEISGRTRSFISSNVRSGSFNKRKSEMLLTFKGNRKYRFFDVPFSTFRKLLEAPSKGRFVNRKVNYKYDYERIK